MYDILMEWVIKDCQQMTAMIANGNEGKLIIKVVQ